MSSTKFWDRMPTLPTDFPANPTEVSQTVLSKAYQFDMVSSMQFDKNWYIDKVKYEAINQLERERSDLIAKGCDSSDLATQIHRAHLEINRKYIPPPRLPKKSYQEPPSLKPRATKPHIASDYYGWRKA